MRIDLKSEFKELYRPPAGRFTEVDVPEFTYLMVDGHGDPNTSEQYAGAVESLFTAAYAIRAAFKRRTGSDFVVGPLEGLWSSADPADFVAGNKSNWDWTMMIPLPRPVTREDADLGLATASARKPQVPIAGVRVCALAEGRCLQIMHMGSYDDEAPTLARLHHEVMPARGLTWNGRHHEIYLGDPRRAAPEKLRTILRQPVRLTGQTPEELNAQQDAAATRGA